MSVNEITGAIIQSAINVHKELGPGLLESVYKKCLARELGLLGIRYELEVPLKVTYKGIEFDGAYRMDMVVANSVVVELKVVETVLAVHEAQLLSYLRLANKKVGLLINFHTSVLKSGIRRLVNNL